MPGRGRKWLSRAPPGCRRRTCRQICRQICRRTCHRTCRRTCRRISLRRAMAAKTFRTRRPMTIGRRHVPVAARAWGSRPWRTSQPRTPAFAHEWTHCTLPSPMAARGATTHSCRCRLPLLATAVAVAASACCCCCCFCCLLLPVAVCCCDCDLASPSGHSTNSALSKKDQKIAQKAAEDARDAVKKLSKEKHKPPGASGKVSASGLRQPCPPDFVRTGAPCFPCLPLAHPTLRFQLQLLLLLLLLLLLPLPSWTYACYVCCV